MCDCQSNHTDHGRALEQHRPTLPARILILCVRGYQHTLSHIVGGQCRFQPTCSNYGIDALTRHGALFGSWLTIKRICRCHPWNTGGYDPVPGNDPAAQPRTRKAPTHNDDC